MNTKNAIQQAGQGGVNTPVRGCSPPKASGEAGRSPSITQGVFLDYLIRLLESGVPGGETVLNPPTCASAHALPAKTRGIPCAHSISYSSESKGKRQGFKATHVRCTHTVWLPLPRAGPGSWQGCEAGLKSSWDRARHTRRVNKPSADGGRDCQVPSSLPGLVNVRDPHLKLGPSPDS